MAFKAWNNRLSRTKWEDHMPLTLKSLACGAVGACLLAPLSPAAFAQAVIMERQLSFDAARTMATAALETHRRAGALPQERPSRGGDRGRQCRRGACGLSR